MSDLPLMMPLPEDTSFELTAPTFPEDVYVLAGTIVDEDGQEVPQTFLQFAYVDEEDKPVKVTFAMDNWSATKLGLSISQAAIQASEHFMSTLITERSRVTERPQRPSPYM